jgi:multidrug efflux pump subunit AcrB
VVLKAQDSFRRTPESLASATVRTASGSLVPLRNRQLRGGFGPGVDRPLNRQRQITVSGNPAPGFAGRGAAGIEEAVFAGLDMAPGYNLVTSGSSRDSGARCTTS